MRYLFLIICFCITLVYLGCTEEYPLSETGYSSNYTGKDVDRILGIAPNPAMSKTEVIFMVMHTGKIKIYIASVTGIEKMLLTDKEYSQGDYVITVNLSELNDGIYMLHFVNTEGLHSWEYLYKGRI